MDNSTIIAEEEPAQDYLSTENAVGSDSANGRPSCHAMLRERNGQIFLEAIGPQDLATVNGKRIAPGSAVPLKDGDSLQLGGTPLKFSTELFAASAKNNKLASVQKSVHFNNRSPKVFERTPDFSKEHKLLKDRRQTPLVIAKDESPAKLSRRHERHELPSAVRKAAARGGRFVTPSGKKPEHPASAVIKRSQTAGPILKMPGSEPRGGILKKGLSTATGRSALPAFNRNPLSSVVKSKKLETPSAVPRVTPVASFKKQTPLPRFTPKQATTSGAKSESRVQFALNNRRPLYPPLTSHSVGRVSHGNFDGMPRSPEDLSLANVSEWIDTNPSRSESADDVLALDSSHSADTLNKRLSLSDLDELAEEIKSVERRRRLKRNSKAPTPSEIVVTVESAEPVELNTSYTIKSEGSNRRKSRPSVAVEPAAEEAVGHAPEIEDVEQTVDPNVKSAQRRKSVRSSIRPQLTETETSEEQKTPSIVKSERQTRSRSRRSVAVVKNGETVEKSPMSKKLLSTKSRKSVGVVQDALVAEEKQTPNVVDTALVEVSTSQNRRHKSRRNLAEEDSVVTPKTAAEVNPRSTDRRKSRRSAAPARSEPEPELTNFLESFQATTPVVLVVNEEFKDREICLPSASRSAARRKSRKSTSVTFAVSEAEQTKDLSSPKIVVEEVATSDEAVVDTPAADSELISFDSPVEVPSIPQAVETSEDKSPAKSRKSLRRSLGVKFAESLKTSPLEANISSIPKRMHVTPANLAKFRPSIGASPSCRGSLRKTMLKRLIEMHKEDDTASTSQEPVKQTKAPKSSSQMMSPDPLSMKKLFKERKNVAGASPKLSPGPMKRLFAERSKTKQSTDEVLSPVAMKRIFAPKRRPASVSGVESEPDRGTMLRTFHEPVERAKKVVTDVALSPGPMHRLFADQSSKEQKEPVMSDVTDLASPTKFKRLSAVKEPKNVEAVVSPRPVKHLAVERTSRKKASETAEVLSPIGMKRIFAVKNSKNTGEAVVSPGPMKRLFSETSAKRTKSAEPSAAPDIVSPNALKRIFAVKKASGTGTEAIMSPLPMQQLFAEEVSSPAAKTVVSLTPMQLLSTGKSKRTPGKTASPDIVSPKSTSKSFSAVKKAFGTGTEAVLSPVPTQRLFSEEVASPAARTVVSLTPMQPLSTGKSKRTPGITASPDIVSPKSTSKSFSAVKKAFGTGTEAIMSPLAMQQSFAEEPKVSSPATEAVVSLPPMQPLSSGKSKRTPRNTVSSDVVSPTFMQPLSTGKSKQTPAITASPDIVSPNSAKRTFSGKKASAATTEAVLSPLPTPRLLSEEVSSPAAKTVVSLTPMQPLSTGKSKRTPGITASPDFVSPNTSKPTSAVKKASGTEAVVSPLPMQQSFAEELEVSSPAPKTGSLLSFVLSPMQPLSAGKSKRTPVIAASPDVVSPNALRRMFGVKKTAKNNGDAVLSPVPMQRLFAEQQETKRKKTAAPAPEFVSPNALKRIFAVKRRKAEGDVMEETVLPELFKKTSETPVKKQEEAGSSKKARFAEPIVQPTPERIVQLRAEAESVRRSPRKVAVVEEPVEIAVSDASSQSTLISTQNDEELPELPEIPELVITNSEFAVAETPDVVDNVKSKSGGRSRRAKVSSDVNEPAVEPTLPREESVSEVPQLQKSTRGRRGKADAVAIASAPNLSSQSEPTEGAAPKSTRRKAKVVEEETEEKVAEPTESAAAKNTRRRGKVENTVDATPNVEALEEPVEEKVLKAAESAATKTTRGGGKAENSVVEAVEEPVEVVEATGVATTKNSRRKGKAEMAETVSQPTGEIASEHIETIAPKNARGKGKAHVTTPLFERVAETGPDSILAKSTRRRGKAEATTVVERVDSPMNVEAAPEPSAKSTRRKGKAAIASVSEPTVVEHVDSPLNVEAAPEPSTKSTRRKGKAEVASVSEPAVEVEVATTKRTRQKAKADTETVPEPVIDTAVEPVQPKTTRRKANTVVETPAEPEEPSTAATENEGEVHEKAKRGRLAKKAKVEEPVENDENLPVEVDDSAKKRTRRGGKELQASSSVEEASVVDTRRKSTIRVTRAMAIAKTAPHDEPPVETKRNLRGARK